MPLSLHRVVNACAAALVTASSLVCLAAQPPAAAKAPEKMLYVTDGLVLYYNFDEGSGAVARDLSGRKNDGRIQGPSYEKMPKGSALRFTGADDCVVNCGKGPDLDLPYDMSLEAWVAPEGQFTGGLRGIIGRDLDSFGLNQNPTTCYRLHINDFNNLARSAPVTGTWQHIVATFDGKKIRVYVNGELNAEADSKYDSIAEGREITVGYAGHQGFIGRMDEVRIYNRALTPDEVKSNFTCTKDLFTGVDAAPERPASGR